MSGNVVVSYTDQDAVTGGVLIPPNDVDRITIAVWNFMCARAPENAPYRWPFDSPTSEAMYPYLKRVESKVILLCRGITARYSLRAREIYENNEAGGIWYAALDHTDDTILGLRPGATDGLSRLWLLPNELGGVTLMFPEDY